MVYYPEVVQYNQRKNRTCKFQIENVKQSMVIFFLHKCIQANVSHK